MELVISSNNKSVPAYNEIIPLENEQLKLLPQAILNSPKIKQLAIINLLNHLNFIENHLTVHLHNLYTDQEILVNAFPEPCLNESLKCSWLNEEHSLLNNYIIKHIIIDNNKELVIVPVETVSITEHDFTVSLPKRGFIWNNRETIRYSCEDLDIAANINNDTVGALKSFSSSSLCIKLDNDLFSSEDWIFPDIPYFIKLYKNDHDSNETLFSGYCNFDRMAFNEHEIMIIFTPYTSYEKYKTRENRNPRISLSPRPKVIFKHPLMTKTVQYEAADISTLGFSVILDKENSLLIPGLFFSDITIIFSNDVHIKCSARIVYQLETDQYEIKYGFSIQEMKLKDNNLLYAIISNAEVPQINMSYNIDLDELWEFLFKSRFIYPKKFELLSWSKAELKETYRKLYHNGQDIFTNIIYQKNSKIYGHCSLIKAYERSWLVQHLAAINVNNRNTGTGLVILNQVLNYAETLFKLPDANMDCLMFYYRPNNRFSNYFFGGFYRELNKKNIVSEDLFAYLTCSFKSKAASIPNGYSLGRFRNEDLEILKYFYNKESGGLLLKAFGFDRTTKKKTLADMYAKIGLNRSCKVYSLKKANDLQAVIIVDQADTGINMSELLNCIKVIVLNPSLSWNILYKIISNLSVVYKKRKISIMIYPDNYLESQNILPERFYNLWIANAEHGYEYINYLKQRANPRQPSLLRN